MPWISAADSWDTVGVGKNSDGGVDESAIVPAYSVHSIEAFLHPNPFTGLDFPIDGVAGHAAG